MWCISFVLTKGSTKFSCDLGYLSKPGKMWVPSGSYFKSPFSFSLCLNQSKF
jgi:hypothetical protein